MSRLDSFIRRVQAQRACLDRAAELIADVPGPVLELGLGNGRTYDHLREQLPARRIFVFERLVQAHLWDEKAQFFKVQSRKGEGLADVRELHGYSDPFPEPFPFSLLSL
jgi:hypothetical protein